MDIGMNTDSDRTSVEVKGINFGLDYFLPLGEYLQASFPFQSIECNNRYLFLSNYEPKYHSF